MSEIIDILTLPPLKAPYITVNKAAAFVPLLIPGAPDFTLYNADFKHRFVKGDNVVLLTAGIILPESFTAYKVAATITPNSSPRLRFQLEGIVSGQTYYADVMGYANEIYIPLENHETALDVFIDCKNQRQHAFPTVALDEAFYFTGGVYNLFVSMAGCPASLDGKDLIVTPFYKILHNSPMY